MDKKWISEERGHSLFELSLSLPIMLVLTLTLGAMFLWTMKIFIYEMADWELQMELYTALQRVAGDARTAGSIRINHKKLLHEGDDHAYCSINIMKPQCYPSTDIKTAYYEAANPDIVWKIYRNSTNEPITGDSIIGDVHLSRFHCEIIPPARLRIEIGGMSGITGHKMDVSAEIFVPELMKNGDTTSERSGI